MSAPVSDTVSIVLDGKTQLSGWQSVNITLDCERVPNAFELRATEHDPTDDTLVTIMPGTTCTVMIGRTVVITGVVDRYLATIGPSQHEVVILGRGVMRDMVDSSSILPNMVLAAGTLKQVATALAQPYGIKVRALSGDGSQIPQINITVNQTPYELVELLARWNAQLAYEDSDGNLVLAQAGVSTMASGFQQGVNVQGAQSTLTMDERFNEYVPLLSSTQSLADQGPSGNRMPSIFDEGVTRFRQLAVICELSQNGEPFAITRARWEAARRKGRSQSIVLTCDSWRDSAGTLWQPNALALVDMPALKVSKQQWVIGRVSFLLDGQEGTRAQLHLMPKDAFSPEPDLLQPYLGDIAKDNDPSKGAAATPPADAPLDEHHRPVPTQSPFPGY